MREVPEWFGTKDAAIHLGITLRTLYRIIDEGLLPAYKFGRVLRVKFSDVVEYMESAKVEPGDLRHLYPEPTDIDKKEEK